MSVVVGGKSFDSKIKACEYYGVPRSTLNLKMRKSGLSFEKALLSCVEDKKIRCDRDNLYTENSDLLNNSVDLNGKHFDSVLDACRYYGVSSRSVVLSVIEKCMSVEEALVKVTNAKISAINRKGYHDEYGYDDAVSVCDGSLSYEEASSLLGYTVGGNEPY